MRLTLNITSGSSGWRESFPQTLTFCPDPGTENEAVNLYPDMTDETFEGFGGAVTESAAYVYSLMDEEQKRKLLEAYFTPERMNYTLVRVHLDSCDFCVEPYEAMSDPDDRALDSFSFERTERYILPMLRDAEKMAGKQLPLMLSPWSPPVFMKTNGERQHGGRLKPEYYDMWADYLCRYILEFRRRGFLVQRVSLQNEPHAVQTWDSCLYTAEEQKIFLRDHMYPALVKNGLGDVEVFLWDHNKERLYEWMRGVIDSDTDSMVAGAAFHWYSGDHFEQLELARKKFPGKRLILSESCIEYSKFDPEDEILAAVKLSHEIIGDLNHGMTAFYDWNLLLDENGGPTYVNNFCLAPFHYDTREKQLKNTLHQRYFEHFSHNLLPGSVRIGTSCYTEQIDVTAWRRPDGTLLVILLNKSNNLLPVCLRLEGQIASFLLPPRSIVSGIVK